MSYLDQSPAAEWDRVTKKIRDDNQTTRKIHPAPTEGSVSQTAIRKAVQTQARKEELADQYLAKAFDVINPDHYKGDGIECIDYIKQTMPREAFLGYLEGNVVKYRHRYRNKNGIEDLRKARWYLDRLIQEECDDV